MSNKNNHELHKFTGDEISKKFANRNYQVIKAPECCNEKSSNSQNIPLFRGEKSNSTEYCNVDILILQNGKVRVIIEIDESNTIPVHTFGKFLASALSEFFRHKKQGNISLADSESVLFVQIIAIPKTKTGKTSKPRQGKNIEDSINKMIKKQTGNLYITDYKLFTSEEKQCVAKKIATWIDSNK